MINEFWRLILLLFVGEEDQNSARSIVVRLSKSFAKHQPKKANEIRPIPTQVSFHSMDKVLRPVEGRSSILYVNGSQGHCYFEFLDSVSD